MMDPRKIGQFLMGEWNKTEQPLEERAGILPIGKYQDGSVGMAWPEILAAPGRAVQRSVDAAMGGDSGYYFGDDGRVSDQLIRDSIDIAGGAMTGSLGTGLVGGFADNALASGGAKLTGSNPDLPMDLASRMARAREMGFDTDTTWYHGTDRPGFTEFSKDAVGSRFQQDDVGHFFMNKPKRVEGYAGDRTSATGEMVGAIYPTHIRPGNQFVLDEDTALNAQMADDLQQLGPMAVWDIWHPHLKEAANGADSILVKGADEQMMVAMDPRNIRSTNAAFDPAKKDSANLLAANAPTGAVVPAGLEATDQDTDITPVLLQYLKAIGLQ